MCVTGRDPEVRMVEGVCVVLMGEIGRGHVM